MNIRLAMKDDLEILVKLLNEVTLDLHNKGINQWEYPWDSNELSLDIKNENIYIVTKDNVVIGTFSIKNIEEDISFPIDEGDNWYLYRIAIAPDSQGKGIGDKIVKYACRITKDSGRHLYLDCWAGNTKLKEFYSTRGFEFLGDFKEEDYMISGFKLNFLR